MGFYDAKLGVISDNGVELEMLGGLNFIGFTISLNAETNQYNIAVSGAATGSDDVTNDSDVDGDTVTDALEALDDAIAGLASTVSAIMSAGSSGALQRSDGSGGFADSGVTATSGTFQANVINVGNGTIGTGGDINFESAWAMYAKNTAAGSSRMFGWGGADFSVGDATWSGANAGYYDAGPTGAHVFRHGTSGNWCTFDITSSRKRMHFADDATINVPSGKTLRFSVNDSAVGTWSSTGLAVNTLAISGVTTLNGARVLAPTQRTNLTDADQTIHISDGANAYMAAGTTTTARNKTLGTTGASNKRVMTLGIAAQGHNVVIKDDAGTTLHTVVAGNSEIVDCWYNGSTSHYELGSIKPAQ